MRVGDFIKLRDGDRVPADCILIRAEGHVFIQTASLDGEKNLKPRMPNKAINERVK